MTQTELGPLVVHHEAVRAVGQSDKMRPSFSRILSQLGITSGPFYEWMSMSPLDMEGGRAQGVAAADGPNVHAAQR